MNDTDSPFQSDAPLQSERLLHVPLDQLTRGPSGPASSVPHPALVDSIRKFGMLQPLLARKTESGYEVVAGFKRLAAAPEAGLTEVPVRIYRVEDSALGSLYTATNIRLERIPVGPGKTVARNNGLSRLFEEELNTPRSRPPYKAILGIATAIILISWVILSLWGRMRNPDAPGNDPAEAPPTVVPTQQAPNPTPRPQSTRSAAAGSTRATPGSPRDWQRALSTIQGVELRDVSGTPRIIFTSPIFSSLTTIDPSQKQRLLSVITAIRAQCDACMVAVVGHTDNDPVRPGGAYASNEELGRLRAEEVVKFLTQHAGIPTSHLRPLSTGANDPPYSNDTAANKRKNRTVTLEIIQPSGVR